MNRIIFISLAIGLGAVVLPMMISATTTQTVGGNLSANIQPRYPEPGQEVNIRLTGFGFSLDNSLITWQVNGREVLGGVGERIIQVRVGELGSQTRVIVRVDPPTRSEIVKVINFRPAQVDLLIDADTSVPPNYPGATLPTAGSDVRITAIPHLIDNQGKRIDRRQLNFKWQLEGRDQPQASGEGRQTMELNNLNNSTRVSVTVTDPVSHMGAQSSIEVKLVEPIVQIYEVKPLMGPVYNRALIDSWRPATDDFTLMLEPFYFPRRLLNTLEYFWQINDQSVAGPNTQAKSHNFTFESALASPINLEAGVINRLFSPRPLTSSLIITP